MKESKKISHKKLRAKTRSGAEGAGEELVKKSLMQMNAGLPFPCRSFLRHPFCVRVSGSTCNAGHIISLGC